MAAQLAIDRLVGAQKALEKYTTGLALRGRDLRYAGLEQADMRKADLRSADLQGADLRGARLSRATIGDDPYRDDFWRLADLRGADAEPVDLAALIAEMQDERKRAKESWRGSSQPIRSPRRSVGMGQMRDEEYDKRLAAFLGDLACNEDGNPAVAERFARRVAPPLFLDGESPLVQSATGPAADARRSRRVPGCRRSVGGPASWPQAACRAVAVVRCGRAGCRAAMTRAED
jgi:hypothetical protein